MLVRVHLLSCLLAYRSDTYPHQMDIGDAVIERLQDNASLVRYGLQLLEPQQPQVVDPRVVGVDKQGYYAAKTPLDRATLVGLEELLEAASEDKFTEGLKDSPWHGSLT